MNILDQIVERKWKELAELKILCPVKQLEQSPAFSSPTNSLKEYLLRPDKSGIIAEFKRKSPSKGIINADVSVEQVTVGYVQAGASALSVLTDSFFFGGSREDLTTARRLNSCPILRKDFVLDEYQILEAKSIEADAILLIAAILDSNKIQGLVKVAHGLGLEVLLEVHDQEELLMNLESGADLIGVNNRNLKTFQLSVETSRQLASLIPDSVLKVSESGIDSPETIKELKQVGYKGFLIGQTFMQHVRPEVAAMDFIKALRKLENPG